MFRVFLGLLALAALLGSTYLFPFVDSKEKLNTAMGIATKGNPHARPTDAATTSPSASSASHPREWSILSWFGPAKARKAREAATPAGDETRLAKTKAAGLQIVVVPEFLPPQPANEPVSKTAFAPVVKRAEGSPLLASAVRAGFVSRKSAATPAEHQALVKARAVKLAARRENERRLLAMRLQRELARVGCYRSRTTGTWGYRSRRAMTKFLSHIKTRLPVDEPDAVLLAIVEKYDGRACGPCLVDQVRDEKSGRCVMRIDVAEAGGKKRRPPAIEADGVVIDVKGPKVLAGTDATRPSGLEKYRRRKKSRYVRVYRPRPYGLGAGDRRVRSPRRAFRSRYRRAPRAWTKRAFATDR